MASNFTGTKAYTLNRLITEVSNISRSQGATASGVVNALSPRYGSISVKFDVIDTFLNGQLSNVLSGSTKLVSGSTARTRLLRALRSRKSNGSFAA